MTYKVLVIEDHREIADLVKMHLSDIDCRAKIASDGATGLADACANNYDLIILDLMLPGESGLDICRRLRARADYTPILMLTARSSELDRVLGLELGADDYLTKPFSVLELQARVKAIFRRVKAVTNGGMNSNTVVRAGHMMIDADKRSVFLRGREVDLTATTKSVFSVGIGSGSQRSWFGLVGAQGTVRCESAVQVSLHRGDELPKAVCDRSMCADWWPAAL